VFVKKYFIYLLCTSFGVGAILDKYTGIDLKLIIITAIIFFVGSLIFNRNRAETIFLYLILLSLVPLGYIRHDIKNRPSIFVDYYDQKIQIIGEIQKEPSLGSFSNRYVLSIDELRVGDKLETSLQTNERIIISTSKYPLYQTGDIVSATGKIEKPENFQNENGIEFNYVNFLAKDNIYAIMSYSGVKLLDSNKYKPSRVLYNIKNYFLTELSTVLESPHAELMGGLLLGVKQSLGDQLEKEFRIAGLIHVVVLSGYNITIIIVATFAFLSFLPLKIKYLIGALFVLSFSIMVGAGATVVRASLMAFLVILGKYSHRNYNINKSLFFAGLVMIINNPLVIFYDPSFQLSFVASLGLVNLSEKISRLIKFVPSKFEMREIIAAGISTQIAVLPMIMKMTGELSIIALPANLIVLPMIPVTMLLGFVTGLMTILFWPAGLIIGVLPNALLGFQLEVVGFFANLPFAMVQVKPPTFVETVLFYCFIVIVFYARPIQIFKKVLNVLTLSTRLVVSNK
jgi:competence protein ComEC